MKIDKDRLITDKEYFKEKMLEKIKNNSQITSTYFKQGLCFIFADLMDYGYGETIHIELPFLKPPFDTNEFYGYNSDGSIRESKNDGIGFWFPINQSTCTMDEWYEDRIKILEEL